MRKKKKPGKKVPNPAGHGVRKLMPQHKITTLKKNIVVPTRVQADFLLRRIRHGQMAPEQRAVLRAFLKKRGIKHNLKELSRMASKLLKNYRYEEVFEPDKFAVTPKVEAQELKEFRHFLMAMQEARGLGMLD